MELTEAHKGLFQAAAEALTGSARRVFMARTVVELGPGGQRRAERELGWDRGTIRKGARELASGFSIVDAFALRGRKRAEAQLPTLLADITALVDGQSQTDPSFRTTRLYTRLTAAEVRGRFAHITTLVLNLDNGPESHSHRTQFMQRLVRFAQQFHLTVRLAYYPPYYSKYNPIERCWGILEQHWNGTLLDTLDTVLRVAATMTWKGVRPTVTLVTTAYERGVTLTKVAMTEVETHLARLPHLAKWFVDIAPAPVADWET